MQVDAIRAALNAMGFKEVEIVIAETGWPYKGDSNEVGPSIENAKAYNGNLIAHLRSMVGTPLMPGKSVDTYLFAIYDEDLKPGPTSERSFGLFKPDLTMSYDIGLSKANNQVPTPKTPVSPSPNASPKAPVSLSPNPAPKAPVTPTLVPTPNTTVTPPSPKTEKSVKAGVSDSQSQANINVGMLVLSQILWYPMLHMR